MVRGEETKTAALILVTLCLVIHGMAWLAGGIDLGRYSLVRGCSLMSRMSYHFLHTSMLHAVLNCWCLLSVVFVYRVPIYYLALAFVIATTIPSFLLSHCPTVGLSGVCFALIGMIVFQTKRRWVFHLWVLLFVLLTSLMCSVMSAMGVGIVRANNVLHVYCYVVGLVISYLNSPAHGKE